MSADPYAYLQWWEQKCSRGHRTLTLSVNKPETPLCGVCLGLAPRPPEGPLSLMVLPA